MLIGRKSLAHPLTIIINASITQGKVPDSWKEAVVIPILKKGDAQAKDNYRPVSILTAASKVMEKVVCAQVTDYLEDNNFLPVNFCHNVLTNYFNNENLFSGEINIMF